VTTSAKSSISPWTTIPETIAKATQILDLAAQPQQSKLLVRFFAYCNVQRLLGQDPKADDQLGQALRIGCLRYLFAGCCV
jgi:hypothetical protein